MRKKVALATLLVTASIGLARADAISLIHAQEVDDTFAFQEDMTGFGIRWEVAEITSNGTVLSFNSGMDWEIGQETAAQLHGGISVHVKINRAKFSDKDPQRIAKAVLRNISGVKLCVATSVSTQPPVRSSQMTHIKPGRTKSNTDNYFDKGAPVVYV